jgi:hypothetical protein
VKCLIAWSQLNHHVPESEISPIATKRKAFEQTCFVCKSFLSQSNGSGRLIGNRKKNTIRVSDPVNAVSITRHRLQLAAKLDLERRMAHKKNNRAQQKKTHFLKKKKKNLKKKKKKKTEKKVIKANSTNGQKGKSRPICPFADRIFRHDEHTHDASRSCNFDQANHKDSSTSWLRRQHHK